MCRGFESLLRYHLSLGACDFRAKRGEEVLRLGDQQRPVVHEVLGGTAGFQIRGQAGFEVLPRS